MLRTTLRLRAAGVGAALALGAVAPVVAAPPALCAGEGPRAVLVVDRENGTAPLRMCVALPSSSVSGLDFIELAGDQYDLQYRFGHGGAAVCQLANVPAQRPPSDCLRQGHPFWGYWRSDGGPWQWSGSGAASTRVSDGDVEGWSFGQGNDGSTHPQPPATRASDVCKPTSGGGGKGDRKDDNEKDGRRREGSGGKAGGGRGDGSGSSDREPVGDRGGSGPGGDTSAKTGSGGNDGADGEKANGGREDRRPTGKKDPDGKSKHKDKEAPAQEGSASEVTPPPIDLASPSPSALPASATGAEDDETSAGFPLAGLIALGATAFMGIAAAVVVSKRRRKGAN